MYFTLNSMFDREFELETLLDPKTKWDTEFEETLEELSECQVEMQTKQFDLALATAKLEKANANVAAWSEDMERLQYEINNFEFSIHS